VLMSNLQEGEKGPYRHNITWTPNKDGSVSQIWSVLNEEGDELNTLFYGIYRKE